MKNKGKKETANNIKAELNKLLDMNRKRKSALKKISKFVLDGDNESKDKNKDEVC